MKALGCYIFAGGFTLGVKKAGFEVPYHLEGNDYGVKTAQLNFPDLQVYYGPDKWPVERLKEEGQQHEWDFLFGNPPCAAWSVAGYTKTRGTDKWRKDPRVECTTRHFNLMRELRPKVWAWESVTQAYTKGHEFVRNLERDALDDGYSVSYVLHDAQYLGLPQVRRRFFMVCHRVELSLSIPNWSPPMTTGEALAGIKPEGEPHQLVYWSGGKLEDVPPGWRLRDYWEEKVCPPDQQKIGKYGQVVGRPSFGHKRLDPDKPAHAIVGYCVVHPTEHRFLTIPEMQVLSGFPSDWKWSPNSTPNKAHEMARGVCPTVAEWLARGVAASVTHGKEVLRPTVHEYNLLSPPEEGGDVRKLLDPDRPEEAPKLSTPRPKAKAPPGSRAGRKKAEPEAPPPPPPPLEVVEAPLPNEGEGKMDFVQRLIMGGDLTSDQIVFVVRKAWPDARTSRAVVSDQRGVLREEGKDPPPALREKKVEVEGDVPPPPPEKQVDIEELIAERDSEHPIQPGQVDRT